jgi:hypothetical protein
MIFFIQRKGIIHLEKKEIMKMDDTFHSLLLQERIKIEKDQKVLVIKTIF